nr:MAG TPA: hypothetical protein [Caudoviricetes sp.]
MWHYGTTSFTSFLSEPRFHLVVTPSVFQRLGTTSAYLLSKTDLAFCR